MTIKKIVLLVISLIVFLILLAKAIIPQIVALIEKPGIETWTGLSGGLHLLPWILCVAIVVILIFSLKPKRGDDV